MDKNFDGVRVSINVHHMYKQDISPSLNFNYFSETYICKYFFIKSMLNKNSIGDVGKNILLNIFIN